jgi:hypothetical protein
MAAVEKDRRLAESCIDSSGGAAGVKPAAPPMDAPTAAYARWSNWPPLAPFRNTAHSSRLNRRVGPSWSLESRTPTPSSSAATSTQVPAWQGQPPNQENGGRLKAVLLSLGRHFAARAGRGSNWSLGSLRGDHLGQPGWSSGWCPEDAASARYPLRLVNLRPGRTGGRP